MYLGGTNERGKQEAVRGVKSNLEGLFLSKDYWETFGIVVGLRNNCCERQVWADLPSFTNVRLSRHNQPGKSSSLFGRRTAISVVSVSDSARRPRGGVCQLLILFASPPDQLRFPEVVRGSDGPFSFSACLRLKEDPHTKADSYDYPAEDCLWTYPSN